MKLGTHVHYTKTSKFSYSAKPDYTWSGCGGHFPKWPLSQKLRGAEPSTFTVYIGFVKRKCQKKYCEMYHTTLSDIVKAILQNGGHFQSNTSISETKRRRAFNVDSIYIGFVGRIFQIPERYCRIHLANVSAFMEGIFTKMATIINVMRLIFETMRPRNVTVMSTHIIYGQHNSYSALLRASHNIIVDTIWLDVLNNT